MTIQVLDDIYNSRNSIRRLARPLTEAWWIIYNSRNSIRRLAFWAAYNNGFIIYNSRNSIRRLAVAFFFGNHTPSTIVEIQLGG